MSRTLLERFAGRPTHKYRTVGDGPTNYRGNRVKTDLGQRAQGGDCQAFDALATAGWLSQPEDQSL